MSSDLHARVRGAVREHLDAAPPPVGDIDEVLARAARPATRRFGRAVSGARLRWLAPLGAAVAVAAAIAVSLVIPRLQEPPPAPPALPWLPRTIEKPSEPPSPLPADRAVGRGSAIYQTCVNPERPATCRDHLVTEDGKHYEIPGSYDRFNNHDEASTLSPDGRWLGVARKGEHRLRDLMGGRVHTIDGDALIGLAWSSDSRWLLLGSVGVGPDPEPVLRVDTRTGHTREVTAPFHITRPLVVDVTRDGEVLLLAPEDGCAQRFSCGAPRPNFRPDVMLVDPDRGSKPVWTRELDWGRLRGSEKASDSMDSEYPRVIRLAPDGVSLIVALGKVVEPEPGMWKPVSGDLLLFDLTTGKPTRRYDIVDGTVSTERPNMSDDDTLVGPEGISEWRLVAHEGGGILLMGYKVLGENRIEQEIALVDPQTGTQRTATRVRAHEGKLTLFAVRGSIR